MNRMISVLAGLLLIAGAGTALAKNGPRIENSALSARPHVDLLLHDPIQSSAISLDAKPDPATAGSDETWPFGYAINQQVIIRLDCRDPGVERDPVDLTGVRVDWEHVTSNILLGVHYKF